MIGPDNLNAAAPEKTGEQNGEKSSFVNGEKVQEESFVYIPDMFSSIMAAELVVNPHGVKTRPEADSWVAEVMGGDEKWAKKNSKAEFPYLCALWAPYCDEETLRVMSDWMNWVFLFDDQFDEGHLVNDLPGAQKEIERTLAILDDDQPPVRVEDNPVGYVFQTIWNRFKKRASADMKQQWRDMHARYFNGLLIQVKVMTDQRSFARTVEEYMDTRRRTIGVYPSIALTSWAQNVHLSSDIISHPSLEVCMEVTASLVVLVNDLTSYTKDLELGVDHNIITLLKSKGHTTQEAMDEIGRMTNACYKRWYTALADMPIWGEQIDQEVLKFLVVCRDVALGNLHWSFMTGRYMGSEGDVVRKTRIMKLPGLV